MDHQVTATYCLVDDFLRSIHHGEPADRVVSDAEVLTVALVAARTYSGNSEAAWRLLTEYGYMARRPSSTGGSTPPLRWPSGSSRPSPKSGR